MTITNNDDSNGTYEFTMNFSLTQGQVYFVKVGHYNLNGTGAYTLNITAPGSAADDYGNTYNSAYNLSLSAGSTISKNGSLEVANDVDYFKFTAPNTGIYNIYSSNITVDLKGWLYNSAQTLLQSNDDSNGSTNFFISRSLTQGQVYYIKVGHYNFEGTGTYTLNIACTSTIDDYGNTFATAYNMSVSSNAVSSRNGTLEIANDVDFFKFIAPTTGSYTINSSNSTVDVRGWLYNSSQVEIANNDDSNGTTNFSMTYTLTQGQVYYVKVSHYSLGGTGTYTISITPNGNTVTYNGNGNTAGTEPLSQTWISGSTLTLRANTGTLAKTGYTFAGWNTNASGTGTNYSAGQTGVNLGASSITLYAKWTPNTNTVTYNGNYNSSGSVPASQTWTSGSLITLRTNTGLLAKNGFTFSGWNTNTAGTGTNYTAGQTGVNLGLSSLILYAKWLDTTAPTVPTNFVKTSQSETQVAFSWTSSTDNVGVIGYNIYRNSSLIGTTTSTSYIDNISSLSSGTYSYTIQAKDEMENLSGLSNAVSVTTTISDWYRVTGSDEYGNTATVYLSDIAATEDGNLVTAIAQSSLDGGFWQKLIYDGYSWDYSGIAFTGDPFSGVSVATIQDPFVNNNYNFSTFEDITLNTNDNTSIIQTSAINIKEINYDSVKNSILNMILGQLGIGEGDFEPDDLYYLAQGISVGIDDNLTLGIAQKIFKLKTSYDEYFFIEGKKITDASFLAYYSLAATGSATASGYLLASATLKASGGGLCLATVGGAPLGASLEVSAAADATVASALAIQSVLLAAAAENSKTNLESTGTAERNLPTKNAGNFRSRLSTLTGKIFDRFTHAHHMFPQKKALKQFFVDKGIDIHDAKYGSWVPAFKHLSESRAFNKAWETWIESNQNATIEVIIQKARDLAIQFGYEINF